MPRPSLLLALVAAFVLGVVVACGSSAPTGSPAQSTAGPTGDPSASPVPAASATVRPSASPIPTPRPTAAPTPEPTATEAPGPTRSPEFESPEDLEVGDCYDPIEDADDDAFLAAIILPCAEPHRAEVFGMLEVEAAPTARFPGYDEVEAEAEDLCDAAFEDYLGISFDRSRYGYIYYTQTEETWAGGDRLVMCVVDDNGRPIEGSVRGSRE
jgi:hypothetical protein